MNKQKLLIAFLIINLFIANNAVLCAESKKQKPPKTVSNQLRGSVQEYKAELINKDWWDKLNDPILTEYIVKATEANQDLKIATLKVAEAQAQVQEFFGKEFPYLALNSTFYRQKLSENTSSHDAPRFDSIQNIYNFPLSVNYELDLWRKNRERTISMAKELEAVRYSEKAAYIALASSVATAYFNAVKTDKLIQLQKDIVNLRTNKLDLIQEKNNYGLCPYSDIIQAKKALIEAQTSLADLEKQRTIFLNMLATLTGESVENTSSFKRTPIDNLDLVSDLPLSIPSETIMHRPDILKAEAELQKSRIDIKLARKDLLPSINITGQFGFNANSLRKVFNWDSYVASVGAGLLQSIFTGGQSKARLKARKLRYEQMLENYQKTILQSFQEVNDSLVSLKTDSEKNNDNTSRIKLEKDNLNLVDIKYNEGAISYLDTLEYKEKLFQIEKEQAQSKTECLIDLLSLYKAVGGKL